MNTHTVLSVAHVLIVLRPEFLLAHMFAEHLTDVFVLIGDVRVAVVRVQNDVTQPLAFVLYVAQIVQRPEFYV